MEFLFLNSCKPLKGQFLFKKVLRISKFFVGF